MKLKETSYSTGICYIVDDEVKPLSAQEKYKEFQMALVTLEKSIKDLNIGEQDRYVCILHYV